MILKSIPGFCFVDPTNRETVNIRFTSVNVVGEPRIIRALWTPEMAQDVAAFHNIDAEAELTALLAENLRNEIDQQILQDLRDNQRFYDQNRREEVLRQVNNRWNQIGGNILINHHGADIIGHRVPEDNQSPNFGGIALPIARRVAAQTVGLDLVGVRPLVLPRGLLEFLDHDQEDNFMALPNEEGWYTKGTFESILIKIDMLPFKFIPKRKSRRRRN